MKAKYKVEEATWIKGKPKARRPLSYTSVPWRAKANGADYKRTGVRFWKQTIGVSSLFLALKTEPPEALPP